MLKTMQSFASLDNTGSADSGGVWENQSVAQTLMVALAVVMGHEVLNRCPQGAFSKQDQPFQTGFLDAAHKSLGVSVQIRTSRWQLHGLHASILQRAEKLVCEQRIAIMDEIALIREQSLD